MTQLPLCLRLGLSCKVRADVEEADLPRTINTLASYVDHLSLFPSSSSSHLLFSHSFNHSPYHLTFVTLFKMKATFFYVATLAAGAFAAPAVQAARADIGLGAVNDAVHTVDGVVAEDLGIGQLIDAISLGGAPIKRDVKSSGDVITVLTGAISTVQGNTGSISKLPLNAFYKQGRSG